MMTTRRGGALRAVRVRRAFGLSMVLAFSSATVAAQSDATRVRTTLHGDSSGCLTERALDARIVHYLSSAAQVMPGLRVHVRAPNAGATEFEIELAGKPLAIRRFEMLPKGCSDRVNAIAIAIAIAVEQAAHSQAVASDAPPRVEPAATPPAKPDAIGGGVTQPNADSRTTTGASPTPAVDAQPKRAATADPKPRADETAPAADPRPRRVPSAPVAESHDADQKIAEPEPTPDEEPTVLGLSLQAGGSVVFGVLPAVAIAGVVGGELSFGGIRSVRLSALVSAETRTPFEGGHALVQLVGGRCLLCHRMPFGWAALHPCLGVISGGFLTEGEGYEDSHPDQVFWLATLARLGFRLFDSEPLAVELSAEIYANLVRPQLGVEGSRESLTAPYVGASGGLEISFALF